MFARYTRRVVLTRRSILLSIAILLSTGSSLAFPSVRAGPPICQAPTASICGSQGFQPNDPLYPNQWGLQDQDLIDAWQLTTGTKRIIVAVVDTGVMLNHPDLQTNLWA